MPSPSDAILLLSMSRGDESAARALSSRIGPRLTAYARALLRDDAAAEDAVQQAWLRALSRPASELKQINDATAWLIRLTRTAAFNHSRSRSRATARERLRLVSDQPVPSQPADHTDLHAAIDALPDDQRELVLLKHVADLTFDQIAETLGENRSTLASRYRTALDTLRRHLQVPYAQQEATCA